MFEAEPMMEDRRADSYGFTAGVLTGLLVGGAVALLFAPKAGAEVRGKLSDSMDSMRGTLGRRYRDAAGRAGAGVDRVKEKARSMAATARDYMEKANADGAPADQPTQH